MKYTILFLACLLLPGISIHAQDAELDVLSREAAESLSSLLRDMETLTAEVNVLTLEQDGREIQETTSRLIMQKPDHFSWETLSPYPELLVTNGSHIWRFEYDLEQVTIESFSDDINRTPVLLLNGNANDIAETYYVSQAAMELDGRQRFILSPRVSDSLYTRMSLTFNNDRIEEMQFESSLGQKTSLTFANLEINAAIDPLLFMIELPEDMEVIDNTGEP